MISKAWLLHFAYLVAVLTAVPLVPARADFFDDARKTIKVDIPHFFQHDIPCAFGGKGRVTSLSWAELSHLDAVSAGAPA